jgi:aryl-alcohol dehydrogenase-like predicted oxidoreductase
VLRDDVLTCIQQLAPLAQAESLSMAQLAVAWVLQNDNVASAITGGSRLGQVTSNAAVAGHKLAPETMAGIDFALSHVIETDRAMVGATSPKQRLR